MERHLDRVQQPNDIPEILELRLPDGIDDLLYGLHSIPRQASPSPLTSGKTLQVLQRQARQFYGRTAVQERRRKPLQAVRRQNPDDPGHVELDPKIWTRPTLGGGPF